MPGQGQSSYGKKEQAETVDELYSGHTYIRSNLQQHTRRETQVKQPPKFNETNTWKDTTNFEADVCIFIKFPNRMEQSRHCIIGTA